MFQTNKVFGGLGKGRAHLPFYECLDLAELLGETMLIVQQNSVPERCLPVGGHGVPPLQNGVIYTLREKGWKEMMGKEESATLHEAGQCQELWQSENTNKHGTKSVVITHVKRAGWAHRNKRANKPAQPAHVRWGC